MVDCSAVVLGPGDLKARKAQKRTGTSYQIEIHFPIKTGKFVICRLKIKCTTSYTNEVIVINIMNQYSSVRPYTLTNSYA